MLERIPEDKYGWKPHNKSLSFGELASHLANICTWTSTTLKQDSYDIAPPGGEEFKTPQASSRAELVGMFDKNTADAREAIAGTPDDEFMKTWTMYRGGEQMFALPKYAVLRSFIFNHAIHHRAQLGVYYRLNDLPVPAVYGPSADENP